MSSDSILKVRDLCRSYRIRGGLSRKTSSLEAVKGVSFDVERGTTLAVVGESGCGKSTLAHMLVMIDAQTSGSIELDGTSVNIVKTGISREMRRQVQIVFQNPYGSLNPRQKVGHALEEPLLLNTGVGSGERRDLALAMLEKVGLSPDHYGRYPHMFSGGQRQRIAIARAIMLRPKLLVLDEPVSALDLSVQAQILNLLANLQDDMGLTYVFISHDLSVVRYIADKVMVMHFGEIVEYGTRDEVFDNPQHDYTKTLLAATPRTDIAAIRNRLGRDRSSP